MVIDKIVMIVEDNELNMKLLNDLLQAHGYQTIQVVDGRDVIRLMRENKPNLVLMDILLPGISGLEVTKVIKNDVDLKSIPIIAVTALAMRGDEERFRTSGCDGYIAKPISTSALLETVEEFLH